MFSADMGMEDLMLRFYYNTREAFKSYLQHKGRGRDADSVLRMT